jgi:hypothetical protein
VYIGDRLRKLKKWGKYFIIVGEEPEAAELLAAHEIKKQ